MELSLERYASMERDEQGNMRLPRDEFGHLRLGEIEIGRMMREALKRRMKDHGLKRMAPTFVDKDLGYELRCADPIPFDAEYTRNLGYAAVKFLHSPKAEEYGAIIRLIGGTMDPMPFDPEKKRLDTRYVDVKGESYEAALQYMIRLEREDFEDEKLNKIAAATYLPAKGKEPEFRLTPEQFRQQFGYLVGLKS
jgi:6-phosphofructokinase 1